MAPVQIYQSYHFWNKEKLKSGQVEIPTKVSVKIRNTVISSIRPESYPYMTMTGAQYLLRLILVSRLS